MKVTLEQLLQYFDKGEEFDNRIQIVTDGCDWQNASEVWVGSELLKPFMKRLVSDMSCELSKGKAVLRIAIDKEKQNEQNNQYNQDGDASC